MAAIEYGTPQGRSEHYQHVAHSKFWETVMHDVYGPRQGGAIIFVDSENARKGTAKTSGAVAVARLFAKAFGYQLKFEDFTLSGLDYLDRYREHPGSEQPSVLVLDEFVGAGSGDARRAMSNENLDFGRAWQLLRTKRVITLATLPDWNEADTRLQKYADYRIWMRERPIGHFQPYKITTPFAAGGGTSVKLKGLKRGEHVPRIKFPNMDAENDPYYTHLTSQKDELIHSETWDANSLRPDDDEDEAEQLTEEEIERREAIKYALRLYEPWHSEGPSQEEVAAVLLKDEWSKSWVGNIVREWDRGKHRDLVPEPDHIESSA